MDIQHQTLTLDRTFSAEPAKVFQAYTDTAAREAWSAPDANTEIRILNSDIRIGGSEEGRCGARGQPLNWRMAVRYHLVDANRLINFAEELWEGDRLLTVALITFDLRETAQGGTGLILTDQITSYVGMGGISGHEEGYQASMNNLAMMLSDNRRI